MSLPVAGRGEYQWILTTEDGKQYQGKTRGGETLPLPAKLPEGYHSLTSPRRGSAGTAELSSRQRAAMSRSR
ncbi:4-alpha-glucanotransferase (amylomaltase) [Klebsiella pneumoniae IS33]|nr:4-alpha-glucanotransferase (amylomaltase) [Klebsiella pneumoniae IS33]